MKILVTGGLGFIGSHIVEYHLNKNDAVYVVDNLSTGSLDNLSLFQNNPDFQFDKADILTWQNMEKAVAWADRIYHMAAVVGNLRVIQEPINVIASNIAGTERLFNTITKIGNTPRVILASTSEVYGKSSKSTMQEEDDLIIENPVHLHSNYAISKLSDEIIGLSYDRINNIPTTIIRFFNTIGPRQTGTYGFVVPKFIAQACKGEPISIYGDGSQTRSFGDVRDVVVALDLIAENIRTRYNILNVGVDHEITIKALANLVRERANSKSDIIYVPYKNIYGMEFLDIMHRRPDLTKLHKLIQFKHKWTLEKTVDNLIGIFNENSLKPQLKNKNL
ncbi:MAG TPA: GDP-mannose 4,6-dehydratase [Gammaproteobacteria bacterium]|nr:GDP-mannose 4,6-dehydratase [Gammaproteobacteria bacterium]